jgi:16S rRNA (cytidine1402-2'-O)-methyltransferase
MPPAPVATDGALAKTPSLYVVATPLGNLADITLRAREVLGAVDVVAAEDTRHSQRLLDALGIRTRLVALHEHNEEAAAAGLIRLLEEGRQVALITDAGTPAVSDPGARAVARVQEAGYPVVPVPGPSAAIAALSASGLTDAHFHFHGFLPVKSAARRAAIEALRAIPATLVFYEAPHRIAETVADLAAVLEPGRQLVIARELTKLFEQIVRLPLAEGPAWLAADPNRCRGEFVLLVSAPPPAEGLDPAAERVLKLLLAELPVKSAARLAAEITGASKNLLYQRALALKGELMGVSSPPV